MKSFSNVYEVCLMKEVRLKAAKDIRRSKRVRRIMQKEGYTVDSVAIDGYDWIQNYKNSDHIPIVINDGISKKKRTILVPTVEELFVQHCAVEALKPMFFHGMYEHSYGSIPKRGVHKGAKLIKKWIKHDKGGIKYVLKMDIRHFFDSISHNILKDKLAKKLKDPNMLALLYDIIDVTDNGLPLGYYTSQWLANWYLQDFDHFVKEELGVNKYIRYVDDLVIYDSNKKRLHEIRRLISNYLDHELGLSLKDNWQIFRFSYANDRGRDLDFMGFRFYRNKTTLRKAILLRATRKASKMGKKMRLTVYDARQMLSYLGWIKVTNTYNAYETYIKPFVNFGNLKKILSLFDTNYGYSKYRNLISLYS